MPRLADLLPENNSSRALNELARKGRKAASRTRARTTGTARHRPANAGNVSIAIPDFVAIDLETTGLEFRTDRITEIGLVRFTGGRPREEFSTLVNPGIPIPQAITALTGISDATVADAPPLESILDKVVAFIGRDTLCGHQVDFDFNFLNTELKRRGRPKLNNAQLDTASLARLTLLDLPGYSLGQVALSQGITLANAHRALDDARASGEVAATLIPRLADIPTETRQTLARFAPASVLKTILTNSIDRRNRGGITMGGVSLPAPPPKLGIPRTPKALEDGNVTACYSRDAGLGKVLEGYEPREPQIRMSRDVAEVLNDGGFLVAEAGTGTGKSLAYLMPAALWAKHNDTRVLVSTHTRNLQDQLITKDLPVIRSLVGGIRYSVLKGRANYLCRHRWHLLLSGKLGNLSPRERAGILPLIRWAQSTETGDIEGQRLFNRRWFAKVWNLISAQSHECLGRRCPMFGDCFLQHARQRALGSHVVVINHALFFSEICSENSFLGRIGSIVFDEAHHLESSGHHHLRTELDTARMTRYLDFLGNLLKRFDRNDDSEQRRSTAAAYKSALKRLRKESEAFLGDLARWLIDTNPDAPSFYQIPYTQEPFETLAGKAGFEIALHELQDTLRELHRLYAADEPERDGPVSPRGESDEDTAINIVSCAERTSQLKADLAYLTRGCTEGHVFWIEGDRRKGWVKLCGVPLDIGELLGGIWERNCNAAVFTSATLSVAGSMDFFKRKVGLVGPHEERTRTASYPSPFSSRQMLACAVKGELDPTSTGFDRYVADAVRGLLEESGRNILVLFTARSMLQDVYALLKEPAGLPEGTTALAQNLSGPRHVLIERFKASRGTALLGTDSFWEGIDAPGEACEIVMIPRLPFPVPTHPLARALAQRAEKLHGESFFSYAVPEAVIKFRQGTGRLIRSSSDRGALVVLDSRMVTKNYGRAFAKSIGDNLTVCSSVDDMRKSVATFLTESHDEGELTYEPVEDS